MEIQRLKVRIRGLLLFFMAALLLSGITAFPLEWEVKLLYQIVSDARSPLPGLWPELIYWIGLVKTGLEETYRAYPFMAYGTDWLAFAHIVIAVAFWGPLKEPVRNIWVVEFGLIACVLVIPLAFICGPIRGIPFFWQLIDCSFGVVGLVPLWLCRRNILRLAEIYQGDSHLK